MDPAKNIGLPPSSYPRVTMSASRPPQAGTFAYPFLTTQVASQRASANHSSDNIQPASTYEDPQDDSDVQSIPDSSASEYEDQDERDVVYGSRTTTSAAPPVPVHSRPSMFHSTPYGSAHSLVITIPKKNGRPQRPTPAKRSSAPSASRGASFKRTNSGAFRAVPTGSTPTFGDPSDPSVPDPSAEAGLVLITWEEAQNMTFTDFEPHMYIARSELTDSLYPSNLEPPSKLSPLRCLMCKKIYNGPNARSMWRRHIVQKHQFVLGGKKGNGKGKKVVEEDENALPLESRDEAYVRRREHELQYERDMAVHRYGPQLQLYPSTLSAPPKLSASQPIQSLNSHRPLHRTSSATARIQSSSVSPVVSRLKSLDPEINYDPDATFSDISPDNSADFELHPVDAVASTETVTTIKMESASVVVVHKSEDVFGSVENRVPDEGRALLAPVSLKPSPEIVLEPRKMVRLPSRLSHRRGPSFQSEEDQENVSLSQIEDELAVVKELGIDNIHSKTNITFPESPSSFVGSLHTSPIVQIGPKKMTFSMHNSPFGSKFFSSSNRTFGNATNLLLTPNRGQKDGMWLTSPISVAKLEEEVRIGVPPSSPDFTGVLLNGSSSTPARWSGSFDISATPGSVKKNSVPFSPVVKRARPIDAPAVEAMFSDYINLPFGSPNKGDFEYYDEERDAKRARLD